MSRNAAASGPQRPAIQAKHAPVAQLDRALDYESRGQEFESLRARHLVSHDYRKRDGPVPLRRAPGQSQFNILGDIGPNGVWAASGERRPVLRHSSWCFAPLNFRLQEVQYSFGLRLQIWIRDLKT
jgi:hypothetical protein